ncbi:hypothetical protein CEXT_600831 [Caerostris extrusa]|uniref:Uncharacterized protein n=1 Tax=Caerostris extrusa TaxID=172846 RepID=A0AAV4Y8U2_CAEEX|nr:hypothetical protein CEXT_600831 [Caerostris extrusa]
MGGLVKYPFCCWPICDGGEIRRRDWRRGETKIKRGIPFVGGARDEENPGKASLSIRQEARRMAKSGLSDIQHSHQIRESGDRSRERTRAPFW